MVAAADHYIQETSAAADSLNGMHYLSSSQALPQENLWIGLPLVLLPDYCRLTQQYSQAQLPGTAPGRQSHVSSTAPGIQANIKGTAPSSQVNLNGLAPGKESNLQCAAPGNFPLCSSQTTAG